MRIAISVLLIVIGLQLKAQNGDCNTAISVCNNLYEEDNAPMGTGQVFEMAPGSCQTGGEFNSSWYVFTVQEDGALSFILEPNDNWDDYDWSLFDITDNGCAGINNGMSPEVSCNSYGILFGAAGPTGMSTAMGGSGTSNGPGDLFGPPFNADHQATAGQTYALVVMNWTGSTNGYSLDFSNSNTSIYDVVPPDLVSIQNSWCTGEVILTFSEEVDISALNASHFGFSQAGYNVTSIGMNNNATVSNQLILTVNGGSIEDNVNLTLVMNNSGVLADLCGNAVVFPLALDLVGEFNYTTAITPACNGTGGSLNVTITDNANQGPFIFEVNGGVINSFPMQNLSGGALALTITDPNGCSKSEQLTIENQVATIQLPQDVVLCSMNTILEAQYQGQTILWGAQSGITFGTPNSASTTVTAAQPQQYTIQATAQTGTCTATDNVAVTFNIPPVVDITTENISCFGACDGSISVINAAGSSISIWIDEQESETGVSPELTSICAGNYDLTIMFGANCFSINPVVLTQPAEVVAGIDALTTVVDVEEPFAHLTSTSANATSIAWRMQGSSDILSAEQNFVLELPQVPGVYVVELYAYGENGCMDVHSVSIVVESSLYMFVPNAFTPNQDKINDVFRIEFSDTPLEYELRIFNRSGMNIFTSNDPEQVWTGDVLGGDYYSQTGTYQWRVRLKAKGDIEAREYTGHVSILR